MSIRQQKRIETINNSKHAIAASSGKMSTSLKGLFLLINEYYWKTFTGPFFTFLFPMIIIGLLGWMLGYFMILSGSLGIGIMSLSLTSMPMAIYEFKSSSLLKRIGATPIKPWIFIFCVCSFYIFVMIVSLAWSLMMSMLIFFPYWDSAPKWANPLIPSLKDTLKNINWGGFIYAQFLTIVIGASIGMMLVSIARTSVTIQSLGVIILIISMFLSGQVFPLYIVKNIDFFWYLGYVVCPFKSTAAMTVESWYGTTDLLNNIYGSNIFDVNTPYTIVCLLEVGGMTQGDIMEMVGKTEKIVNLILPFAWIIIFATIAGTKFRWSTR